MGAWTAFGLLLAAVLAVGNQAPIVWALEFSVPMAVVLGFLALSCWYMIRVLPARETPWPQLIGTWLAAGLVLIAIWLAIGYQWANFLLPVTPDALQANLPLQI